MFSDNSRFYLFEIDDNLHAIEVVSNSCLCGKCKGPLKEFVETEYKYDINELRRELAHLKNKGKNICPDCVCKLYKCDGDK